MELGQLVRGQLREPVRRDEMHTARRHAAGSSLLEVGLRGKVLDEHLAARLVAVLLVGAVDDEETSSMVIEVSAMLVATTTLTAPGGGALKTLSCCSADSSGAAAAATRPATCGDACSISISCWISFMPGRKISTAPPPAAPAAPAAPPFCPSPAGSPVAGAAAALALLAAPSCHRRCRQPRRAVDRQRRRRLGRRVDAVGGPPHASAGCTGASLPCSHSTVPPYSSMKSCLVYSTPSTSYRRSSPPAAPTAIASNERWCGAADGTADGAAASAPPWPGMRAEARSVATSGLATRATRRAAISS